jgi:hypothetical protein
MVGVVHTTIDRANGCALGFFVEAHALGAFARHDVVILV